MSAPLQSFRTVSGGPIDAFEVGELLASLTDKSLVAFDQTSGRYHLSETVRDYARILLNSSGEAEPICERHLSHVFALVTAAEPQRSGAGPQPWIDTLEPEFDNVRTALAWSATGKGPDSPGLKLAAAVARFWDLRGYLGEGRKWLSVFLANPPDERARDVRANALSWAGRLALQQGDYAAARVLDQESLAIRRELGDWTGIANSLNNLGNVASNLGDYVSARAFYEQSLDIWMDLGDRGGIAAGLNNLGTAAYRQNDYSEARTLLEEALAIKREMGDRWAVAYSLGNLGNVAGAQGDDAAALALLDESLTIFRDLGVPVDIATTLEILAPVISRLTNGARAARIWGAAERLREDAGTPLPPSDQPRCEQNVASARAALGDDNEFDRAWQEGRVMTMEQAIEYALRNGESDPEPLG